MNWKALSQAIGIMLLSLAIGIPFMAAMIIVRIYFPAISLLFDLGIVMALSVIAITMLYGSFNEL